MTSVKPSSIDTARRVVSGERAPENSRKTHMDRSNRIPHHHHTSSHRRKRPQVRRIAVRFASQPPQMTRAARFSGSRSRNWLTLRSEIKTQSA